MRLREAIKNGTRFFTRQLIGDWAHGGKSGCVLATAYAGLKGQWVSMDGDGQVEDEGSALEVLHRAWPFLESHIELCPVRDCTQPHSKYQMELSEIAMHLNDTHKWNRYHIATWLDQFEPQAEHLEGKSDLTTQGITEAVPPAPSVTPDTVTA